MKFSIEIEKDIKELKCIRFPKELIEEINDITNKNKITFSKFVILACKYALNNMEDE